jgi:hypothetical protein
MEILKVGTTREYSLASTLAFDPEVERSSLEPMDKEATLYEK